MNVHVSLSAPMHRNEEARPWMSLQTFIREETHCACASNAGTQFHSCGEVCKQCYVYLKCLPSVQLCSASPASSNHWVPRRAHNSRKATIATSWSPLPATSEHPRSLEHARTHKAKTVCWHPNFFIQQCLYHAHESQRTTAVGRRACYRLPMPAVPKSRHERAACTLIPKTTHYHTLHVLS